MDPIQSTENDMENSTASSDEDFYICDQNSVDSTSEEMFLNGLDPVLDRWDFLFIFMKFCNVV